MQRQGRELAPAVRRLRGLALEQRLPFGPAAWRQKLVRIGIAESPQLLRQPPKASPKKPAPKPMGKGKAKPKGKTKCTCDKDNS